MTKQELDTERDRLAEDSSGFEPKEPWEGLNLIARDQHVGFVAGFNAAVKIMEERRVKPLREALEFYARWWGPHHGNDERTNLIVQETLNRASFKAKEALAQVPELE